MFAFYLLHGLPLSLASDATFPFTVVNKVSFLKKYIYVKKKFIGVKSIREYYR
jgi:hypothetical protein